MVNYMDDAVGNIVSAIHESGNYSDWLIIFSSDNGGKAPMFARGTEGCRPDLLPSWRLQLAPQGRENEVQGLIGIIVCSFKNSFWEGGVRTNAFVSGG